MLTKKGKLKNLPLHSFSPLFRYFASFKKALHRKIDHKNSIPNKNSVVIKDFVTFFRLEDGRMKTERMSNKFPRMCCIIYSSEIASLKFIIYKTSSCIIYKKVFLFSFLLFTTFWAKINMWKLSAWKSFMYVHIYRSVNSTDFK